ncbi:ribbon-helix-helix protein, CopG family [Agathobaculum sp.]|uniref:ribbon-helix-helix protein, CopG family n=1 Tax=Agathobaculum sp. TaxID=2048138 RepID=UPI002A838A03|nr:ribbon-helix-helix protein, CopG family [Agathobaculum sp.]MDY3619004.1 ribbon-helix-helix protein, CopG family [Agathobaculum sp.]
MATYKRVFTLRIGDEVFDKVNALAQKEHRSMTNFIEHVLLSYLEAYERDNGAIIVPEDA